MSSYERTDWRDIALSNRHRLWGADVPATDIDFLEYDNGRAVALCEWKHEFVTEIKNDYNMRAMRHLADCAGIPFFVIIRADDMSWFEVRAENTTARDFFKSLDQPFKIKIESEIDFVNFLYYIRNRVAPKQVLEYIKNNPFVPRNSLDNLKNIWYTLSKGEQDEFLKEITQ